MNKIKSDIEIARSANIKPIGEVLAKAKVPDDPFAFSPMGRHIAKINLEYISTLKERKSNLILVTAITPTPAGVTADSDYGFNEVDSDNPTNV